MKYYGRTTVSEFLSDHIVYRDLKPIDPRLPSLDDLRQEVGLPPGTTPRKTSQAYARVIAQILDAARRTDVPGTRIERLVFIGDTRMNDSTAFENICRAGNWPGAAFIGAEDGEPRRVDTEERAVGVVWHANRWDSLADFQEFLEHQGHWVGETCALLLDLDKTTIGARGRNDQVINQVRVEAATQTLEDVLGDAFDPQAFRTIYDTFNQTRFHPFTSDNQDYLVYLCLVVGSGTYRLEEVVRAVDEGRLAGIEAFMADVTRQSAALPPVLRQVHTDVHRRVLSGDPTPFKAFRQAEYLATVGRMGQVGAGVPLDERLSQEIVITQEVRTLALTWKAQGALLFGLSDKPDEASIPTSELASQGYQPLHRVETSAVGAGDAN